MIQSYRNTISEKDAKLSELQTKLESLPAVDQREQELFQQIADYKEKNNVCIVCVCVCVNFCVMFLLLSSIHLYCVVVRWLRIKDFKFCRTEKFRY